MDRRGFFQRLLGRRKFEKACFAIQVVIEAVDNDLRRRIHEAMRAPTEERPADKRRYYKSLTGVLLEAEPFLEFASFSYQPEPDEAEPEFQEWVSELEAAMATEASETGDDVDGYHRMNADKQYIVVSLVLLLTAPHPWDNGRGALEYETDKGKRTFDDENEDDYTRSKIGELIDSVNYLDFEHVEADATFLMPGSEEDGFSWSDLADEGWEHLKMVKS